MELTSARKVRYFQRTILTLMYVFTSISTSINQHYFVFAN